MFIELMPLIENRPLTITVAALSEGRIRVNVVPQALAKDSKVNEKIGSANKDEIAQVPESAIHALTTPLSLTGTPEEIDAELAQRLETFVDSHLALQQSVDQAKQQIAGAVKAIEERDKNRSKSKTVPPKAEDKPSGVKGEEAKLTADNLSLFEPTAATIQCIPIRIYAFHLSCEVLPKKWPVVPPPRLHCALCGTVTNGSIRNSIRQSSSMGN